MSEEKVLAHSLAEKMDSIHPDEIRVNVHDMAKWVNELRHLRAQVAQLQARGTEMAMERQRMRDPARRSAIMEEHCNGWPGVSQAIVMHMMTKLVEAK